ncbi:unnamed protein product, partial [Porites evermanni]
GGCRRVQFIPPESGYYFKDHVFLNLSIGIYASCEHRCVMESECVSINVGPPINDRVICELSNSDHWHHPEDRQPTHGWTYRGAENLCCSNPCRNNAKCLLGFTDKKYLCVCTSGYTGEHCETGIVEKQIVTGHIADIDECSIGSHDCHQNATCVNTAGHFNCSCQTGFTGNGRLCQDIDECSSSSHDCHQNATCVNTAGLYNCICKPGLTGNGRNCSVKGRVCDYAMLMNPKKGDRGVHGCQCSSDMVVRMRTVLAIPRSCIRVDGTFYIRTGLPSRYEKVFCHMTPINGCGDGGWTLVMKIDGHKKTFTFDSRYWTDNVTYNVAGGTSLEKVETKLSTYWSTPFTRLCLGMNYKNEEAKWISLSYSGSSLWHVISNGTYIPTNLTAGEWKKLLDNSKIWENCTQQGFNSGNENARARIGIAGDEFRCGAENPFKSRIGFGASGNWYGMNNDNSCGNEYEGKVSIVAFGYIFVQ